MDTKAPVVIMLSLGVAVLIWQASGAAAELTHTDDRNFKSPGLLEEQADSANVDNESALGGNVKPESDSNIVGVILGSIPRLLGLMAIPGVLGTEIQTLTPAPWYVAQPIGMLFNIVAYIGGFQVATGREYI